MVPFFQFESGVSLSGPESYIAYYTVLGLIVALSFAAGRRALCHYGSWMSPFLILGNRLGRALHIPALCLRTHSEDCTHCKTCTKHCPMSLDVHGMVERGSMRNDECILCGSCVDGCPKKVIRYGFGQRP